ncbi:MAG: DUF1573 domain-containing protein [Verrucomicrobia bacterium]|nr:DUF1573 domain-containing protein [Verrucomicrobiota bacterium]
MRRRILLIFSFILAGVPCLRGALEWESVEKVVPSGLETERVEAAFAFRNTGEDPVVILDIKHSCGCMTEELDKEVYEPGESGEIRVAMDLDSLRGEQVKTVRVYTSESPDMPRILTFITDVPVRYDLKPGILAWKFRSEPKVRRASLTFHPGIDPDPGKVRVLVEDRDNTGLAFKSALKKGRHSHHLFVEVLPKKLGTMGHSYLSVFYNHGDDEVLVGEVYLIVN